MTFSGEHIVPPPQHEGLQGRQVKSYKIFFKNNTFFLTTGKLHGKPYSVSILRVVAGTKWKLGVLFHFSFVISYISA